MRGRIQPAFGTRSREWISTGDMFAGFRDVTLLQPQPSNLPYTIQYSSGGKKKTKLVGKHASMDNSEIGRIRSCGGWTRSSTDPFI
ncbi:hypothetical protein VTK56DRAFT_9666 [Thermocarpiscus australiensis]